MSSVVRLENFLAKSGSLRGCFRALADVVAGFLGEVSRHPLGQASERLVAEVALDANLGLVGRLLCDRYQPQEGRPTLETIGIASNDGGGAVHHRCGLLCGLLSAVRCVLCCCVCGVFEFVHGPLVGTPRV